MSLLIFLLAIIINPASLILYVVALGTLGIGFLLARRHYTKTGRLYSRIGFAFRILGIQQLIFLILFISFLVMSHGYGLFAASIIVFANTFVAIQLFLLALALFTPIKKRILLQTPVPTPTTSGKLSQALLIVFILLGVGIPAGLYITLGGGEIGNEFVTAYAETVGAVGLVEKMPYEFQRSAAFKVIATNKQDTSICDKIEDESTRFECYTQADSDYKTYTDTCTLYTKAGETVYADYDQSNCIMDKIYQKLPSVQPADTINCTNLIQNAQVNKNVLYLTRMCAQLSLIQLARVKNDPKICNQILSQGPATKYDYLALKQAACLVHFHGSPEWQLGCDQYKDNEYYGINYDMLASCSTEAVEPPDHDAAEKYWFN